MALNDIIYRGEDRELEFVLTDITDNPIHLDNDITGLLLILYYEDGIVLNKYSKNVLAGYNSSDLVITNASAGEFKIKLQAEVTRVAKLATLLAEAKVRYNNVDYSNNTFDSIQTGVIVSQVRNSITSPIDSF